MSDNTNLAKVIIRRKAKRIQRASEKLSYIKQDIENSTTISASEKEFILNQIRQLQPYLKNNDFEENEYNYDNANN